jgi:hypothetical protein
MTSLNVVFNLNWNLIILLCRATEPPVAANRRLTLIACPPPRPLTSSTTRTWTRCWTTARPMWARHFNSEEAFKTWTRARKVTQVAAARARSLQARALPRLPRRAPQLDLKRLQIQIIHKVVGKLAKQICSRLTILKIRRRCLTQLSSTVKTRKVN